MITQKTQYALRAVFELARRYGEGPIKISDISEKQAIPVRFLEVILNQLKGGGFVDSKRGFEGGYQLVMPPDSVSVMAVIRHMREAVGPVHCVSISSGRDCPLGGDCAFLSLWTEVRDAVSEIFETTTFADLVEGRTKRDAGKAAPKKKGRTGKAVKKKKEKKH